MNKTITTLLFCVFMVWNNFAQSTFNIKGIVQDTLDNPLIYSTVLLLERSDSTMLEFTRSALDGSFKFKDVPDGTYLVKTSYLGYIPLTVEVSSADGNNVDMGDLRMVEIAEELMEVVIKAAKAPIKMRGDTIEYDASTFKVPEGSTVEELLRRLPGIEIDADGSINADGKTVSKVTVDGKSFFGDNPQAATKNLPAEGISKVQVFDTKTEQEEITGATSESQDKTMNLELKDDFKTGGFGKVIAGAGTEDFRELKGNYNKFNEKIQFSIVGVANNTGRNGLNWNDYQDFMGSQSFQFGGDYDFGFGGGGRFYYFGGGDSGIESTIQNIFFSGNRGGGLPENYNGGLNFNYDHNKLKISSVYYYNQAGLDKLTDRETESFYPDFVQNQVSTRNGEDTNRGHRAEFRIEKELDSLHSVVLELNGAVIDQDKFSKSSSNLFRDNVKVSQGEFSNNTNTSGSLASATVLFRKKFMKKGRRMGINASILNTNLDDSWTQNSITNFFTPSGTQDSTLLINQANQNLADKIVYKSNAMYVEPLSKKFFWQTFYNFSRREETGDREVVDVAEGRREINQLLSRDFENIITLNRLGSSLRYSYEGINISLGLAYQTFDLTGSFSSQSGEINGVIDKDFDNFIPNLSINFEPARNMYVDVSFSRNATEPSIRDLQPIRDNTNPLYIRDGNPNLTPEISNEVRSYISKSWPAEAIRISLNGSYTRYTNQFSSEEFVDDNLVTTYRPINIEGGQDFSFWSNVSFPIIRAKVKARIGFSPYFSDRPAFVNNQKNITKSKRYTPSLNIDITPTDDLAIYLRGRWSISNTSYDINTSLDQKTINYDYSVQFNTKVFDGIYFNSSFDYDIYTNDRFGVDEGIPLLNASIYKQFGEKKKVELRLAAYDALDKNTAFSQSAYGNQVYKSRSNVLGRYYMLSFTYNIRGLKSGVRKDYY